MRTVALDASGSFSWAADEGEFLERSSTALALARGWLLVDAVDHPELDALLDGRPVAATVCLLERHRRDGERIASRHGVSSRLAAAAGGAGVAELAAGVREIALLSRPWREAALWQAEEGRLVTGEALGTAAFFRARPQERLSVHPVARLLPPRRPLAALRPRQICPGHGPPLLEEAAPALAEALADARRGLPRAWLRAARLSASARRR